MEKIKVSLKIDSLSFDELLNPPEGISLNVGQILPALNDLFTKDSLIIDCNGQQKLLGEIKWK